MTKKQFWVDPYQTELTTTISKLDGNQVELAETIFYAESGGQESDGGTIGGYQVVSAEKRDQSILYTLESTEGFQIGQTVDVKIDWPRRYNLMRLHFAAEVILELFYKAIPNLEKMGAHISESKSRIDFELPESISPMLPEIQAQAQSLFDADLPIEKDFSDVQKGRRYWKVEHFAQVPCGGTHINRTSEVGRIKLKRKNIGKGKERVEIYLV
ncbi:alanine--tRNA ligase-related protein [Marinomonas spartinae]|uniref:alanine--tRNA ligase-related protein n=1 Tax=Marinomonas spartinae TaxID=1792290 RepID=UPI0018F272B4|nr:alanyl-tRNA editing protein [Marinomonas spartinae]MBJ7554097.1 alanyl-tRNA editing protein [Marinomonas spartinae]